MPQHVNTAKYVPPPADSIKIQPNNTGFDVGYQHQCDNGFNFGVCGGMQYNGSAPRGGVRAGFKW